MNECYCQNSRFRIDSTFVKYSSKESSLFQIYVQPKVQSHVFEKEVQPTIMNFKFYYDT